MPPNETVIVTGSARCGSSLTMRMLEAGGFPVHHGGNRTSYETPEANDIAFGRVTSVKHLAGKAIKVLEPHQGATLALEESPIAWIYLTRNAKQQAMSQVKFLAYMAGIRFATPTVTVMKFQQDLYQHNRLNPERLERRANSRLLRVRFEDLIGDAYGAAHRIIAFLGMAEGAAAAEKAMVMAACVLARSPDCALDMSIEVANAKRDDEEAARTNAGPGQ